ncbi:MAG: hypothetical protein J6J33_01515 [Clostridia bacterium]|nr:hypothetical protein [Clostridia bacterium]
MSFLEMLNAIFLEPVISLLEIIFYFVNFVSHSVFLTIAIVAVFINFMFLPISKHAAYYNEKVYQNRFNTTHNKLSKKIMHLQDAKTLVSYFILNLFKVLFFVASLEFFTNLALLNEVNSGFLGGADGLVKMGNLKINLLQF